MMVIFSLTFVSHFYIFGTEYRLYTYDSALEKPSLRIPSCQSVWKVGINSSQFTEEHIWKCKEFEGPLITRVSDTFRSDNTQHLILSPQPKLFF